MEALQEEMKRLRTELNEVRQRQTINNTDEGETKPRSDKDSTSSNSSILINLQLHGTPFWSSFKLFMRYLILRAPSKGSMWLLSPIAIEELKLVSHSGIVSWNEKSTEQGNKYRILEH